MILRFIGLFVFLIFVVCVQSQTSMNANPSNDVQEKILKVKAYVVLKNYSAAIYELEQLRRQTKDETVRNFANSMLMTCYIEQRDYRRAQKLLEESFDEKGKPNGLQGYFLTAAQLLKGIRTQADRYKTLGLFFNDKKLPDDAVNEIEKLRELSELVIQQSKSIMTQENSSILLALIEESSKIRSLLAKDEYDARYWKDIAEDLRQDITKSAKLIDAATDDGLIAASRDAKELTKNEDTLESEKKSNKTEDFTKNRFTSLFRNEGDLLLQVGSLIEYATKKTTPNYPAQAKISRISGTVRVDILVDENGKVISIEQVSGPKLLQSAAVEAVKNWEFKPFLKNGKPVKVRGFVIFNFSSAE
jgi:TonB family protein